MNPASSHPDPLQELARACRSGGVLHRFHARPLLLLLGKCILAGETEQGERWRREIEEAVALHREAWTRAVLEELEMACVEHVRSVDPRFLSRPDYDLHYVVEAREELEARLAAAECLNIDTPDRLLRQVLAADERLAPRLAGDRPLQRPAAPGAGSGPAHDAIP